MGITNKSGKTLNQKQKKYSFYTIKQNFRSQQIYFTIYYTSFHLLQNRIIRIKNLFRQAIYLFNFLKINILQYGIKTTKNLPVSFFTEFRKGNL